MSFPQVGYYHPLVGDTVRLTRNDDGVVVDGVAIPKNPMGTIRAVGARPYGDGRYVPIARVETTDGVFHDGLMIADSILNPKAGDPVVIDWPNQGIVLARFSPTAETVGVEPQPEPEPSVPLPTEYTITAAWSGKYRDGDGWWGDDAPWCSTNNSAVWGGYAFPDLTGRPILRIEMDLPATQVMYSAPLIGTHPNATPGVPTASDLVPLTTRNGRVVLRDEATGINPGWGEGLRSGGGIVIPSRDGTYDIWQGVSTNPQSGTLRIITNGA